jgi:hypothetical protein
VSSTPLVTKKRLVLAVAALVLVLTALSFVLPYVGGGGHGISPAP